ncbi:efflux RND transporter periplasmic adaptor subunit [Arthrobacter sp. AZCC_0090]|uniref:efflux RND transporter periplasmic adaptor subunit n=1 Tax=Arthrobacter sp. AZCC_0090 TaxID=2735881 RepID=UPI0016226B77|nr:efflux RND transporter periplasmic adaptor subunit [Arthrobacter sp. AZCC_0090]MBB6403738.1 multidrug efflux pump subunit AcrA (membrane-fusion protein) [Arthrobacter sp. AZCC_0090]
MGVFRRVILPVAWLLVFAVIAVALVKIAFVDGLKPQGAEPAPMARVETPVVPAARATVTNTVQVKATVQSDPVIGVRSTAAGTVVHIYVESGAAVAKGDQLFQVKAERTKPATTAATPGEKATSEPLYVYTDVLAPAAGKLNELTTLLDQQLSVGQAVGKVDPGTFTVSGPVNAAQQYRLLAKPGSAQISLVGGPAPFACPAVTLKNNANDAGATAGGTGTGGVGMAAPVGALPLAAAGPGGETQNGGASTGTLSCPVPSGTEVFAGLGATMTVSAGEAKDVVTVPLTSVKGSVKEGIVWMASVAVEGKAPEQRAVKLGLNDGSKVEVVSGLAEGEQMLEFVPGAPAAPSQQGYGPGAVPYGPAGG